MTIRNAQGQAKVGVRNQLTPTSSLLTSLYAAYNADNNTNDSFGTNNGTAQGGLTYTTGKIGQAFTFNGTNASINLPNNSMNLTGNYSISCWVYFSSNPSSITPYILQSFNGSPNIGFEYRIRAGKPEINFYTSSGFTSWYTPDVLINSSGWYHLALTHASNSQPKFYLNGVLTPSGIRVSTATIYEATYSSPSLCSIGYNNQALSNYMPNGSKIDSLNIWTKELTSTEVTELYNSGNGKQYPFNVDSDAQAFITAAAITDSTQQSAINTLVTQLKSYGIWTKLKAIYPFVGGNATSHKFNLKDPRDLDAAYRLIFAGGMTHDSVGIIPNGTTSYADTFFTPSLNSTINNLHMGAYINDTGTGVLMGSDVAYRTWISPRFGSGPEKSAIFINESAFNYYSYSTNKGLWLGSRLSSTQTKLYSNGSVYYATASSSIGVETGKLVISARRIGSSSVDSVFNKKISFASIGDGLTDTEAANLYTAVQAFQTTLGRAV